MTTQRRLQPKISVASVSEGDVINKPLHYTRGNVECIDAIRAALGHEMFIGFLRGQVIKYQWRMCDKGETRTDSRKAEWYASLLANELEDR